MIVAEATDPVRATPRRRLAGHAPLGAALLALVGLPAAAGAQTAAPAVPTREEVNRIPTGPTAQQPSRLSVEGGVERAPCPLAQERFAGVTITVNDVVFDNLKIVDPATLASAWEAYRGKTVPIATVCEIRDAAATILRRQGYLAAVQVPPQRIENGVVHFDVLMAKLVAVQVRGNPGKSEALIAAYLRRLTEEPVFNEQTAARYLLLARDIPGYDVRLTLKPANGAPGEVIGEVAVVRTPVALDVNVQNYGSRDVGRFGGLIRGEAYDLLGLGDRLTLGYFGTADFKEQNVLQAGYDIRLGGEGLTLGGRFTYAWTRPDPDIVGGRLKAETMVAGAELSYPFVRREAGTLRGALGFEAINQDVRLAGIDLTRDRIRAAYARADFDLMDAGSIRSTAGYSSAEPRWRLAGSLEVRKGLGILGASDGCGAPPYTACLTAGAVPLSRVEGRPQAALVRFSGVGEVRPVPNIAFVLAPRAQYSSRPLLSYEEFSGGNYTVGRGYDPGSILGDRGIGFQSELRIGRAVPTARDAFAVQPYGFFDAAWVWNRRQPVAPLERDPQRLFSAGIGARVAYGDRARLDVTLATPLEKINGSDRRGDVRLLVSLTTRLLPWTR
ncbi:ShlB/FhaC/HecB family hemolysin secretion/activation protein [Sphingomonas jatrophae]|uniref:ShlB/FhaC/HecB family hemolysin secretion/activation protein n=1 Tax=Sphingomonas jatrophae TaxID=1166337 RepID=UPI001F603AFA|nr:ShlB/FhaC/HecB family hemolysin secretion/activation protein [Sphingomonas jatrophae]